MGCHFDHFLDDSSKIVDFLLLVKFRSCPVFYGLISKSWKFCYFQFQFFLAQKNMKIKRFKQSGYLSTKDFLISVQCKLRKILSFEMIFKWYSYVLHLYRTAAMLFLTLSILLQTIPNIFCGNKSFAKKIPEKITTKCCFCMQLASLLHFPTRAFKYYVDHFLPYFDHLSTSG